MKKVNSLVITGYGINCEREMALAYEVVKAQTKIAHFNELLLGKVKLEDYHILNFPGGFAFADDMGAGKAFANKIEQSKIPNNEKLKDRLIDFIKEGKYIIGVCNGFQILVKLGLLPGIGKDYSRQLVTLAPNDSGRFENRWVYHKVLSSKCVFLKEIKHLQLPVRHGEGKFMARDNSVIEHLFSQNQVTLQYSDEQGEPTQQYPLNPNGSPRAIAGICDETGRVLGMMAHPEAYLYWTRHPSWTRLRYALHQQQKPAPFYGDGYQLFYNLVQHAQENLL